jgi:hypothetical protein
MMGVKELRLCAEHPHVVISAEHVRELAVTLFDSAFEFGCKHAGGVKRVCCIFASEPGIGMVAARVKIHRRIAFLRPGVDRNVGFREDHRSRNPLRFKAVECALQNGSASGSSRCGHHGRDAVDIGKQGGATARKLAHDVPAECLQFVQVSLTLEESHLRTSSAGGCDADTSPTYRRAPAGAFERCAGDSPRWRVGARLPNRGPLRALGSFSSSSSLKDRRQSYPLTPPL